MFGAIEINLKKGKRFVVASILEFRKERPIFGLPLDGGTRLLDAASIRANWNGRARDLVREDRVLTGEELARQYPDINVY
jgi:hypothetical protein